VFYSKESLDKNQITKYGFNKYGSNEMEQITIKNGMNVIEMIEIQKEKSYCLIAGIEKN